MKIGKWAGGAALFITAALGACSLSEAGALNEVALHPPTIESSLTPTAMASIQPTGTATSAPVPTITFLGGDDDIVPLPTASGSEPISVAIVPTQPPPAGVCSAKSAGNYYVNVRMGPGTNFGVLSVLRAGQYASVASKADNGWYRIALGRADEGWVSPKVVMLFGGSLCENLRVEVFPTAPPVVTIEPSLTPTPTAMFGFTMNIPLNHLVTKVTVGSIPAGRAVMVTTTQFTGSQYLYTIVTSDGRAETVTDEQLEYSPNGGTNPFATPTPIPQDTLAPTPFARYQSEIGMNVYRVATNTQIDGIAPDTPVRISMAMYNGSTWLYGITSKDNVEATASESQLYYIPNAGGGGPTPTVTLSPTVPVMELPTDASPSDVVIPDGLCTVTAKSPTNLVKQPASAVVVGVLNPGPWAQVDATDGQGWYKVTIWTDGSQGWATTSTLTLHGPCDVLPVEP